MHRFLPWVFLAGALPALCAAEGPPAAPAGQPLLPMPDANPIACEADTPASIVTRDFTSGIAVTIPEYVAIRVAATGAIEEVLLVHDPIPSLEVQQRASFQKW